MSSAIKRHHIDLLDEPVLPINKRGTEILRDPLLNKGTGFPDSERDELGIRGLVPPQVVSIDDQVQRVMDNYRRKTNDLERYIHLEALHDRNETLYYRVLLEHIDELTPIIYTPVVGQACQYFGHIYRRTRGMYFASSNRGYFKEMVNNWPEDEIDIIVITDGSRILGLGDLGSNGMGIPIGKLSLYVACAGIYPCKTLPVMLDVGTNNHDLQNDILYLGEKHNRLTGREFDEMVEEFVNAVTKRWPKVLIQFEDFTNDHAFPLLERYRNRNLCFNDDIQGTGAVALAGILSALRVTGQSLSEQRFIFLGAGSAAVGIADMIVSGMVEEGLCENEARKQFWLFDSQGLVTQNRIDKLAVHKIPYAQSSKSIDSLLEVVRQVKPTALIGVSKQAGAFTEEVIKEMQSHVRRPLIMALSNPTSKSECTAEQAFKWTAGKVLFASGSPFAPVTIEGKVYVPGQGNNMYIFPGVGLGAVSCHSRSVTDSMFYVAAKTLSELVTREELEVGKLYPDLKTIREISSQIAAAVCKVAFEEGLAQIERPENMLEYVKERMYQPHYVPYKAV
ncbi:MAG: NAD-dependent malic enzyme [SAR324 cluster bacterium]|nr:NAD-dependent malic enzyme [SAR324 cluster bacterium]MBL7034784.1 NAD-dependent malic enzyme [SAR324 cluster bacterium]